MKKLHGNLSSKHLVLDAMGVIYKDSAFKDTLIPFIRKHGGTCDAKKIEELYYSASRGELTGTQFWKEAGINPALEDEYLAVHDLSANLIPFLQKASQLFKSISCLSNGVPEWSKKLRARFGLDIYISQWFISGNLKYRKPSADIYIKFLEQSGCKASEIIFVDDREQNLEAAKKTGFTAVLFDPSHMTTSQAFIKISTLDELFSLSE